MIKLASVELEKDRPPIEDLTRGMLRATASSPPRLKVKAAEARYMIPVTRYILSNYLPCTTDHQRIRLRAIEMMCLMYEEIDAWTADSPDRLSSMCRQFMETYYHLRETAASEVFYKWYPKFHLMIQICESGVCPKSVWNSWTRVRSEKQRD